MSFTDSTYLSDLVRAVLDGLADAFADAGRPVDRAVRVDGEPALDCPGLFAYASTALVNPAVEVDYQRMYRQVRAGAFVIVTLARCRIAVPDDQTGIPASADVDADGAALLADIWITQRALIDRMRDGTLVGGGACTIAHLSPVTPLQPSGGFYGLTTTIDVALG